MLLQLENTDYTNLKKLLDYASKLNLTLRLVDEESNTALPGKPLSGDALKAIIEKSRKSGSISMEGAHKTIRNNFNAD